MCLPSRYLFRSNLGLGAIAKLGRPRSHEDGGTSFLRVRLDACLVSFWPEHAARLPSSDAKLAGGCEVDGVPSRTLQLTDRSFPLTLLAEGWEAWSEAGARVGAGSPWPPLLHPANSLRMLHRPLLDCPGRVRRFTWIEKQPRRIGRWCVTSSMAWTTRGCSSPP